MNRSRGATLLALSLAVFAFAGTAAPAFGAIVYNVTNHAAGQNGWTLAGTITVSGAGTLTSASDVTAWDITATKLGVSRQYSNSTSTANMALNFNGTLNATSTTLSLAAGSIFEVSQEVTNSSSISWQNMVPQFMFDEPFGFSNGYIANWVTDGEMWFAAAGYPTAGSAWTLGTAAAVPEPSAMALLGLGTVGFMARRRRHKA